MRARKLDSCRGGELLPYIFFYQYFRSWFVVEDCTAVSKLEFEAPPGSSTSEEDE